MSWRVIVTPKAEEDAGSITSHIAEGSPQSALKFVESLQDTLGWLAKHPRLGRPCSLRSRALSGYRSRAVIGFPNYLVFYRTLPRRAVRVVRVLHGSMNVLLRLREETSE